MLVMRFFLFFVASYISFLDSHLFIFNMGKDIDLKSKSASLH